MKAKLFRELLWLPEQRFIRELTLAWRIPEAPPFYQE
jgi:hypothetical protein